MAERDAIRVLQDLLGVSLAEAVRLSVLMSGGELDLVEAETSPVAVASLVYQAQLRAARRIADPHRQRDAVRVAREDAKRHHATICHSVPIDPHVADGTARPSATPVYPTPPIPSGVPHA